MVEFRVPDELRKEIDFPIHDAGVGLDGIIDHLKQIMKFRYKGIGWKRDGQDEGRRERMVLCLFSVRTGHVRFFNQLWGGTDVAGLIGDWIAALTNGSMYTYEVAPVFSMYVVQLTV